MEPAASRSEDVDIRCRALPEQPLDRIGDSQTNAIVTEDGVP